MLNSLWRVTSLIKMILKSLEMIFSKTQRNMRLYLKKSNLKILTIPVLNIGKEIVTLIDVAWKNTSIGIKSSTMVLILMTTFLTLESTQDTKTGLMKLRIKLLTL